MSNKFLWLCGASASALFFHTAAFAQTAPTQNDVETVNTDAADTFFDDVLIEEDIVATGTRINSANPSVPLTVFTSEDLELRGIQTIDQLLRQVSGNVSSISSANANGINGDAPRNRGQFVENRSGGTSVDLRGLGAGSTLVLVNGRRLPGEGISNGDFVDISGISIESIERIEILSSGASAIYGADAVAGVVNIILKKDFNGASFRARGELSDAGADAFSVSGTFGKGWGTGNFTGSASYRDQSAVSARDFGITTRDFRPQGGTDARRFTSTRGIFAIPQGSLRLLDPSDDFANGVFVLPENSVGITDFDDASTFDFITRDSLDGGPVGSVSELLPISLQPQEDVFSINGRITQDIDFGIVKSVFAEASYNERNTRTPLTVPRIDIDGLTLADGFFGIPFFDDDSFSGFREDIDFTLDLAELVDAGIVPLDEIRSSSENVAFNLGLQGEFAPNWTWEVTGGYSENSDTDSISEIDPFFVLFGLEDDDFNIIEEPFNLVRNDFLTNEEAQTALARALTQSNTDGKSTLLSFQAIGRGQLFSNRDAGALKFAYGGEYREEDISAVRVSVISDFEEDSIEVPDLDATRTTEALFGEASFPIIPEIEINGALRYENVSNQGSTVTRAASLNEFIETGESQFDPIDSLTDFDQSDSSVTWRVGGSFTPFETLRLRASFGKSFRAPNVSEVGEPTVTDFFFEDDFVDPITGAPIDPDTPFLSGGNENLESETATTSNIGFAFTPSIGSQDFSFDVDYFQINYDNRISNSGSFLGSAFTGAPLLEPAVLRDDSGGILAIFTGPINVADQKINGFDINVGHSTEVGPVTLESNVSIFRLLNSEREIIAGEGIIDDTGVSQPRTRVNYTGSVSYEDFILTGNVNHSGSFRTFATDNVVDDLTTVDLTLAYSFPQQDGPLQDVRLSVGASNIFNTDPSFLNGGNGFSASFYDVRRRVGFVDVRKSF